MVERYLRQSALAHRHLRGTAAAEMGTAGIGLVERPYRAMVTVRGDAGDERFREAVEAIAGVAPPAEPNTVATSRKAKVMWLGPDEWLIVAPPGREGAHASGLRERLSGLAAAVVDVSESRTVIAVTGPKARDLLAKSCTLDLHPRAFKVGACAQTGLARAAILLHLVDDRPTFEITLSRSFADYLWTWLTAKGEEYGVAVLAE